MSVSNNFFKAPHLLSLREPSSPILLGLSGGADSTALLHLLCQYARESGAEIFAAHINHGIRTEEYGGEADRDEQFCRETCKRLGVKLFVKRLDIPKMATASGRSLESEAREARYAFFADIMQENNIKILATAHNADDNLETQIYNLSRGCGIDGLVGIPETRTIDSVEGGIVIRPILEAEKQEIIEFCQNNSIDYVTDSTNFEDDYTRNAIRHKIIPILSELFPTVKRSSLRLSELSGEDSDFILASAKQFLLECGDKLPVQRLKQLHPSVAKRVIMLAFEKISRATLEYVHLSDILSLLDSVKNGAAVSLPEKMRACVVDGYLTFEADKKERQRAIEYSVELTSGLNLIAGTQFALLMCEGALPESVDGYSLYASARLKSEGLGTLCAKNRREGLTILDGGVNKKLKKLMCDKKVPLYDRDTLPLVFSGDELIYAPLCAVNDNARARGKEAINVAVYKIIGG